MCRVFMYIRALYVVGRNQMIRGWGNRHDTLQAESTVFIGLGWESMVAQYVICKLWRLRLCMCVVHV